MGNGETQTNTIYLNENKKMIALNLSRYTNKDNKLSRSRFKKRYIFITINCQLLRTI